MTKSKPHPDSRSEEELTTTSPSPGKWVPTQESFEKLLAAFDSDRNKAGLQYERTRSKLLRYFERRVITDADRYVDETLDRVMRKLDEGKEITNLMAFIFDVASKIRMEAWRDQEKTRKISDELERTVVVTPPKETDPDPRQLCLDLCLDKLPVETRVLIYEYYSEDAGAKIQFRKQMAQRLGIRMNALRIRAHKIRISLEACVTDCLSHAA